MARSFLTPPCMTVALSCSMLAIRMLTAVRPSCQEHCDQTRTVHKFTAHPASGHNQHLAETLPLGTGELSPDPNQLVLPRNLRPIRFIKLVSVCPPIVLVSASAGLMFPGTFLVSNRSFSRASWIQRSEVSMCLAFPSP